jgi:phosphonate dehydrogenase
MEELPLVVLTNKTFDETRAAFDGIARVVANEGHEPWPAEEIMARSRDAAAIMAFMPDRIDGAFLDRCKNLKVIGAALKGFDNIDVEAATERGVWVTIVPDLLTVPTAELAVGLTIALARHIRTGDARIRDAGYAGWRPDLYGTGLSGSTVGIVGFGRVGQAIARCLSGFNCRTVAYDAQSDSAAAANVEMLTLADLLRQSDIVILGLPLTASTTRLIDREAISGMKQGALLINPARGSLVDERAVADALDSGILGGYAADVFECEDWAKPDRPLQIEPRLTAPGARTVLTPHIGSAVVSVRQQIEMSAAQSIIAALSGEIPQGAINAPVR